MSHVPPKLTGAESLARLGSLTAASSAERPSAASSSAASSSAARPTGIGRIRRRSNAAASVRLASGAQTLDALSTSFAHALARARHPELLAAQRGRRAEAPRSSHAGLDSQRSRRRTYFLLGTLGRLRDRAWVPPAAAGEATRPGAAG